MLIRYAAENRGSMSSHKRLTAQENLALRVSTVLLLFAGALALLLIQSLIRGVSLERRTTVESGSVIEPTDPTEQLTEYISHHRIVASYRGRASLIYMRADETAKAGDLPRRVTWHASSSPIRGQDRYDAPPWVVWTGFDWRFSRAEGGRANGEYWSNRNIFVCVPYWVPLLLAAGGGWLVGRRARLKRRRLRTGLCPSCGYDVRATPQQCPECGTAATAVARPAA